MHLADHTQLLDCAADHDASQSTLHSAAIRAVKMAVLHLQRSAPAAVPLLRQMVDPRGRCDRQAFLHIALGFLALQATVGAIFWLFGIEVGGTGTLVLNAPIFWIGTTVCIKRLHDVGRRGWWLPGAFVIWFVAAIVIATVVSLVLGSDALAEGEPAFLMMFAAITLPALAALLWLHTAAGVPHSNAFGPLPTGFGFSMPNIRRHARPARIFYARAVLA